MAYDPKDPNDKKIVDQLIADALAAQAEEHEAEIDGLKAKRNELIGKLKKAREGKDEGEDTEALRTEIEKLQGDLKKANRDLTKAQAELATVTTERDTVNSTLTNTLKETSLTEALASVKVGAQYLPGAKALLASRVELKEVGGERKAFVGDKPLGEFVKEWSQGDEGKAYVAAPVNGGGGAQNPQGGGQSGGKTVTRAEFDGMDMASRAAFFQEGGKLAAEA